MVNTTRKAYEGSDFSTVLDLVRVDFLCGDGEDNSDVLCGVYRPREPQIMVCSMCNKERKVCLVTWPRYIYESKVNAKYLVYCESCATIMRI